MSKKFEYTKTNKIYIKEYKEGKWQEGYFNTAQSIDFNTVEGINITDFLNKSAAQYLNTSSFISMFNKELESGTVIRCEFSKGSTWYKWSAISGGKNVM